jgi:hypothetical protein
MNRAIAISLVSAAIVTGCAGSDPASDTNSSPGNPQTNSAPVAENVLISDDNGGRPIVGDTLTGRYDYADIDGDAEGASIFTWMRSGTPIPGATSISYTLAEADNGEMISFEVTPVAVAGELTGTAVRSSALAVSEASFPQPFDSAATYSNEFYVDGAATFNGDGTQGSPFDNIPSAIDAARDQGAGTRINIAAGTYPAVGFHDNLQGQADAPIAIVADGNVTIDAGGSGTGLVLVNVRYLVLDGLTIQNTGVHGLNISDGDDYSTPSEFIVLRNMHFRNIGSGGNNDCLKMSGVDNFYIENSEFQDCDRGEAIDMVGCHDGLITGNHFHDVAQNAVQTKGGSSNVIIHGNLFVDIPFRAVNAGGNTNELYFRPANAPNEAQNITVVANLFVRTGQSAVVFSGCVGCIATNNTLIEPSGSVFWAVEANTSKGPGRDGRFVNNIVVFNETDLSGYSFFNTDGLPLIDTYFVDANLWFSRDNPAFSAVPNGYGFPTGSNGVVQQDPLLDADYRITAGSPAIAGGIDIPGGIRLDFDGIEYSNPPSIGAFSRP